jgi:hypothetical protein
MLASSQHSGRELVAREGEGEPLGIIVPRLIHHQPEFRSSMTLGDVQKAIVLQFTS